jgi:anion-transporting  ArsA/GET3 family ATPase
MEDALFHQQLKQEYEYRMWEQFVKQKEEEEKSYLLQAPQYFKDLQQYETEMIEKEYRSIQEWEMMTEMAETDYQYCK